MPSPSQKRFDRQYLPIADAIASVDIDQEDRETVAKAIAEALRATPEARHDHTDFRPDVFVLLASDPLVPCAGYDDQPCPHGYVIRLRWHLKDNPDGTGRSAMWRQRAPYGEIRCVTCGAKHFNPDYPREETAA